MLREGEEIKGFAAANPLTMPILAVGAGGGAFTLNTMQQVAGREVRSAFLEGVGHFAALEAPDEVARCLREFTEGVDQTEANLLFSAGLPLTRHLVARIAQ